MKTTIAQKLKVFVVGLTMNLVCFYANGQSTVYYDNFQAYTNDWSTFAPASPANSGVPYGARWTIYSPSGAFGHGAFMNAASGTLRQANTYYANGPDPGFFWIYKAADGWAAGTKLYETSPAYTSTFTNNDSLIVWTIAFRTSSNPTGLSNGTQYGGAFILGTNATNMGVGCATDSKGYAVVFGDQSGDAIGDAIRFVKFDNACNSCSPCGTNVQPQYGLFNWNGTNSTTTLLCAQSLGNVSSSNWYSVKVTFDPFTDTWALYARNDGGTKADPNTLSGTHCRGSVVDNTHTSTALPFMGMYGSFNSSGYDIRWDDLGIYQMPVVAGPGGCGSLINCSTLSSPANGSTISSFCNTTLNWSSVVGSVTACASTLSAAGYSLSVGTNNPPTNILNNQNVGNTTSYNLSNLNPNTTYYWSITPYNGATVASGCNVFSFQTANVTASAASSITCSNTNTNISITAPGSPLTYNWSGPGIVSGQTSQTANVNAPGVYSYTVTNTGGSCSATGTVSVASNTTTPNASAGANQNITCSVTSPTVSASSTTPGATFSWSGPGSVNPGNTSSGTVNTAGSYTATITNPVNGCTNSVSVNVSLNNTQPNISMGSSQSISCGSNSATISGSSTTPGVSYSWSGPGTVSPNNSSSGSASIPGTYTLTVTNPSNGCVSTGTVAVTSNVSVPNISMSVPNELNCLNSTVTVSGNSTTPGVTYSWSTGVSPNNAASGTVNAAGTYTLTVFNPANGCSAVGTAVVNLNNTLPNVSTNASQNLTCTSSTVSVIASSTTPGVTYSWSSGVTPGNTSTGSVAASGNYTVTVTNPANGCSNTSSVSVNTNTVVPNILMANASPLTCTTNSISVSASSNVVGAQYSWSNGVSPSNTSSGNVTSAGVYTVTVTDPSNGCANTATVSVTSNTLTPNITVSSSPTITCTNTLVAVSGSSTTNGVSYSWSSGVNPSNSSSGNVSAEGTYTLTVTDPANGCINTGTVSVSTNTTVPNAWVDANQMITCTNLTAVMSANSLTPGVTFSWSTGVVPGNTAVGTVSSPGNYTVTVTDPANGCSNSVVASVSGNTTLPQVSTSATSTVLNCTDVTLNISANSTTSNVSYQWSSGVVPGNTSSGMVSSPGTYTVTVSDPQNGCENSATVSITQNTVSPNISVGTSQTITCTNTSVSISGNSTTSGATYFWEGPSAGTPAGTTPNASSTTVSATGTYTLTVTDPSNGCVVSATVLVSPDSNLPNISMGSAQVITCVTTSVTVSGSSTTPNAVYSWSNGVSPQNASSGTVLVSGVYTLTVTNPSNGCSTSSTINVSANTAIPNVSLNASSIIIDCNNTTAIVQASSTTPNVSFNWSSGVVPGNTANGSVIASGNYTVTVTDPTNGCSDSTAVVTVTVDTLKPNLTVQTPNSITCLQSNVTVNANSTTPNVNFFWGNGVIPNNASSGFVSTAGVYTVVVTNPISGCKDSATVNVSMDTLAPVVTLPFINATITCLSTSALLVVSSTTPNLNYSWTGPLSGQAAGTTPSNDSTSVNASGTYTVNTMNSQNGCETNATVVVSLDTLQPQATVQQSNNLDCANTSAILTANSNNQNLIYSWSSGVVPSNTSSGTINSAGSYTLTVIDTINGCSSSPILFTVGVDTIKPIIVLSAQGGSTINCNQSSVSLNASATGNANFIWSGPGGSGAGTSFSANAAGTYTVTAIGSNGCTSLDTISVNANTVSPQIIAAASTDTLNCMNSSANLIGNSSSTQVNYFWSGPSGFTSTQSGPTGVTLAGTYILSVTDTINGCVSSDTVVLYQGNNPQAGFTFTPTGGLAPLNVQFTNTSTPGFSNYYWEFGNGSNSNLSDPSQLYQTSGTFNVVLIAYSQFPTCNDTVMATIFIDQEIELVVPNIFTPNGDGTNDLFFMQTKGIRDLHVDIFNRWGQLVAQLDGPNAKWDGITVGGEKASDGTYYYILEARDINGKEYKQNGYVMLNQ